MQVAFCDTYILICEYEETKAFMAYDRVLCSAFVAARNYKVLTRSVVRHEILCKTATKVLR